MNEKQLIDHIISTKVEPKCIQPSFIVNHPLVMSPLAKTHAQGRTASRSPHTCERFELFINKREVVNAYSEQNDPVMQARAFEY